MYYISQEIALIEGSKRTATIVCKTTVELLVILKDVSNNIKYKTAF